MKKVFALLLAATMAFTMLAGCGKKADGSSSGSSASGTRTVVDNIGNTVTIPAQVNRVVIASITPLPSVYCMVMGSSDKIVGMTPAAKNAAVNSLLIKVAPGLKDIPTEFAQGDAINVEELLKLDPDVVLYNTDSAVDKEALKNCGVPAVGFSTTMEGGSTIETLNKWVELLGDVMGEETKAQGIIDYGRQVEKEIIQKVAALSEDERSSALILTNYDASAITAAGNTFGRYWLKTIGTDNVAMEIEKQVSPVSLEQIYAWDPEIIFLNSFSAFTPEDLYNNTAVEGHDWSGLTAVKNKRVYKFPMGMYYWFPPSSDSPLALQWLAKMAYPQLFADLDLEETTKEYFHTYYGLDLTAEELQAIYNPSKDAAMK